MMKHGTIALLLAAALAGHVVAHVSSQNHQQIEGSKSTDHRVGRGGASLRQAASSQQPQQGLG